MTLSEMETLFEKHDGEYGKYDRVIPKASGRPDLDAFILLNTLCPGSGDIISAAEHDEFWISVDPADFAKVADEGHILTLIRCGVFLIDDGFKMNA
jgi:hypothetical protein